MEKNFQELLGGVGRNSAGEIVSAKAVAFTFFGKMNGTAAKIEGVGIDNAIGSFVSILLRKTTVSQIFTHFRHYSGFFS